MLAGLPSGQRVQQGLARDRDAGLHVMALSLGLAAVAAIVGGGLVARLTDRPFWRGAVRQLLLGACAVAITYLIGVAVGHVAG